MFFTIPDAHLADPKYQKEYVRLRLAVADITLSWASLETSMVWLLGSVIDDSIMAGTIFFAPTSLDARIAIVDGAFGMYTATEMPRHAKPVIAKAWESLLRRISAQKLLRNRVAHSALISLGKNPKAKHKPVLSAAMFDTARYLKGQFITAHEIEQSIAAIGNCEAELMMFSMLISDWRKKNLEDFEEWIRGLPGRAQRVAARKGSRNPQGPGKGPLPAGPAEHVINIPFPVPRKRARQI